MKMHPPSCRTIAPAFAAALAVALSAHTVSAADLGGDCCADLEERIAEIEATAARKGNRKLSLRVSGSVSHAILGFDDGEERNAYVVANSYSGDRVRFDGKAKIGGGLSAGYYLEIGLSLPSSAGVTQVSDESGTGRPTVRQSLWYIDSKRLGALSLGFGSPATEDIIAYDLGGIGVAAQADTAAIGTNFFTRDSSIAGSGGLNSLSSGNTISLRWRRFLPQLDTPRANIVRYDSPVWMGAGFSASWGEDDFWDVALRYATRGRGFRLAFGVGYSEDTDEEEDTLGWPRAGSSGGKTLVRELKGSASLLHEPSGLFISGAYVPREFAGNDLGVLTFACFPSGDAADVRAAGIACTSRPDFDYFWVSGGIRLNALSIGTTTLYGEYARSEDAVTGLNVSVRSAVGGDIDYVTSSRMDIFGFGIVQSIPAAAMDIFLSYRHFSADVRGIESDGTRVIAPLEDADMVMAGSRIRF